jgi:hypothetical protein
MAHTCPVCGMTCHCNGDIDDICLDLEEDILACTHCPEDEDDFEDEFCEDAINNEALLNALQTENAGECQHGDIRD